MTNSRLQTFNLFRSCTVGLACGLWLTMFAGHGENGWAQSADETKAVERADPPQFGFYAKAVDCGGIFIRGSAAVQDQTLLTACTKMETMLAQMEVTRNNLKQRGVELHIVGREQKLSELPENRNLPHNNGAQTAAGTTDPNGGRGTTGIYSACGEESLTEASEGTRGGPDLCTREFAIAMMNYGFDEPIRKLIETQFLSSITTGRWRGTRAAAGPQDYWAELSLQYFRGRPGFTKGQSSVPGGLQQYDPAAYALLDLLYSGKRRPVAIEAVRARQVSQLALSRVSTRPAELQLVNNSGQRIRIFWIDTDGEAKAFGELGPYSRTIEKTFFNHVWMIEDQRGVELQRFVIEDYVSEVVALD